MAFLIRLTVALFVLTIVAVVAMWALATFVEPTQREIVIEIPFEQLGI
jgi:hypothetical protein